MEFSSSDYELGDGVTKNDSRNLAEEDGEQGLKEALMRLEITGASVETTANTSSSPTTTSSQSMQKAETKKEELKEITREDMQFSSSDEQRAASPDTESDMEFSDEEGNVKSKEKIAPGKQAMPVDATDSVSLTTAASTGSETSKNTPMPRPVIEEIRSAPSSEGKAKVSDSKDADATKSEDEPSPIVKTGTAVRAPPHSAMSTRM
ncbi:hypothetical protein H0H87_001504 [Tephrocybe sp. NHM501043]|nr:hypothetical protein H0H87_001504 [Tephrocybe sp. NHM501043]